MTRHTAHHVALSNEGTRAWNSMENVPCALGRVRLPTSRNGPRRWKRTLMLGGVSLRHDRMLARLGNVHLR